MLPAGFFEPLDSLDEENLGLEGFYLPHPLLPELTRLPGFFGQGRSAETFIRVGFNGISAVNSLSSVIDSLPTLPGGGASVGSSTVSVDRDTDQVEQFFRYNKPANVYSTGTLYTGDTPVALDVSGLVTGVDDRDVERTYSVVHDFSVFNVQTLVPPFEGTLPEYLKHLVRQTSLGDSQEVVITDRTSRAQSWPVEAFPGYFGDVWTFLKDLSFVHGVDIPRFVAGFTSGVTLLDLYDRLEWEVDISTRSDNPAISVQSDNPAKYVEVSYHSPVWVENGEFYPETIEDASSIQVNAGEIVEVDIPLRGSAKSINQPRCVEWVWSAPDEYDGSQGVYSVVGADNLPLMPSQWLDSGGSLTATLDPEDPTVATVRVVGAHIPHLSPFRIVMSSGNYYNSLRLTGTGTRTATKTVKFPTGSDPATFPQETGETYDLPVVRSLSEALKVGAALATRNGGVSFSAGGITLDQAVITGTSLDAAAGALSASSFWYNDNVWRVSQASFTEADVTLGAEVSTTLGHVQDEFPANATLGDWDAVWGSGSSLLDYKLRPLRKEG